MAGKRKPSKPANPVRQSSTRKSVTMRKVDNGFVVSSFNDQTGNETVKIAKTKKEAKAQATKMMGI